MEKKILTHWSLTSQQQCAQKKIMLRDTCIKLCEEETKGEVIVP